MKKATFFTALSLFFVTLGSVAVAQPGGGYRPGNNQPSTPDYNYRNAPPPPAAPVVIVNGDGYRPDVRDNRFARYENQQVFDRRQRRRLEKRYGFVPPLVVYVPDRFLNRAGDYVSNGGLVYHRGRDGYFHLDNRYYNDRWDDYSYSDRSNDRNDGRWNDNHNRY